MCVCGVPDLPCSSILQDQTELLVSSTVAFIPCNSNLSRQCKYFKSNTSFNYPFMTGGCMGTRADIKERRYRV